MILNRQNIRHPARLLPRAEAAFTMVEIAFSLAIVAFALVAIMGVLPTGMTVQKDNREDTIINNDGAFWAEALRSGSRGLEDLTNYVEAITITDSKGNKQEWTNAWSAGGKTGYPYLTTGEQIIGLLTTPKYAITNNATLTNTVIARVRAINGPAVDKRPRPTNEFAFRYQLESEVTPAFPAPIDTRDKKTQYQFFTEMGATDVPFHLNVSTNLHHLRLTMRWPVFEQGTTWGVGRNRRTVRSLINGQLIATPRDKVEGHTNFYLAHPNIYQYVGTEQQAP